MSKFNPKAMAIAVQEYEDTKPRFAKKISSPENTKTTGKTVNHESHRAFSHTPEMELYTLVCTMMTFNKYYETENEQMERLKILIIQNKPDFIHKLAVYAREKMYLRTIPIVLLVELIRIGRSTPDTWKYIERVIQRPDEITEILAYYQHVNERKDTKKLHKLSNQIKKAIKKVFESGKFNEYQYSKWS